jgi:hypothetical protein
MKRRRLQSFVVLKKRLLRNKRRRPQSKIRKQRRRGKRKRNVWRAGRRENPRTIQLLHQ